MAAVDPPGAPSKNNGIVNTYPSKLIVEATGKTNPKKAR